MNDIILSIKPKYAELILTGKKTVELRKALPAKMPDRVWLYATAPVKRIVGYFVPCRMVKRPYGINYSDWGYVKDRACVSQDEYFTYFGAVGAHYYEIKEAHRCDLPLPCEKAPRNFVYLRESSCDECWARGDSKEHCISMHECSRKKYKEKND